MKVSGVFGLFLAISVASAPAHTENADVASWCPEGQKAFSAGNFEAANLALNNCLHSPPEDPELAAAGYVLRGKTYFERLDLEAALSDFDRAVELSPGNAGAWRSKAWVHYKRNELHPAVEAITKSLEAEPYNTKSHHVHAQILTALGREDSAMDAYDLAYSFESRDTVRKLQQALENQDYRLGAIDGIYGAGTRRALKQCIADRCSIPL